jgi:hypothetical protein
MWRPLKNLNTDLRVPPALLLPAGIRIYAKNKRFRQSNYRHIISAIKGRRIVPSSILLEDHGPG